jgi:hypothetical protein
MDGKHASSTVNETAVSTETRLQDHSMIGAGFRAFQGAVHIF